MSLGGAQDTSPVISRPGILILTRDHTVLRGFRVVVLGVGGVCPGQHLSVTWELVRDVGAQVPVRLTDSLTQALA